jgi:hypothetical protein
MMVNVFSKNKDLLVTYLFQSLSDSLNDASVVRADVLSEAFGKVCHELFIDLQYCGIFILLLNWLAEYLCTEV